MKLLCFEEEFASFFSKIRFRSGDHSKKIFRLFGFFGATRNTIAKILFGDSFIGFAVISTDACATAHKLIDQPIVNWVTRDLLRKSNNRFAESRGALFQVERMFWF